MKKFNITLLAALISSPLAAETIDKTWEVGVFGDYVKSSTNKENRPEWDHIEAGKGLGIDLQKIINDQWNARIELARDRYETENGNNTDYGTRFGLDAIYKVGDTGLYFLAGVKRFNNVNSYNAINAGAGYNFDISERFSLFSEAVVYRDINNGYTDQGFKLGVKYAFGDVKAAPVVRKETTPTAIIGDGDNDGVNDNNDKCKNTSANVKVDSLGCALYAEETVEVNLNVTFENNSAQLKAEMTNDIQRLADFMKAYPNTSVVIEGHSSAIGEAQYNLNLSQKRANVVKEALINDFSIDATRLTAKGFGETQLISTGNSRADHSANRRVVAKIETTVKKVVIKG
ncbi:OmpA family protein [Colwellia sp. D2M02]|uniref:OmpA family protein n=1 Tax=Colwellia sp. D2M02 TaxID=2841562 RepID=UPI001C09AF02|nr:OmpA family protein [Colwellia sp. D2M02]MBU2893670.1 OmpA family protein [Colwellia sp. D2M02]